MILFLMGLNLWNIVQGFEHAKKGEKMEFEARRQQAYAILSLNLSSSCRDCLRDLEGPDPSLAWNAIVKKFQSKSPLSKLMMLDELISFAKSHFTSVQVFSMIHLKLRQSFPE